MTALFLAVCVMASACGPTTAARIGDASVAFSVRTALVNDPEVGVAPIDVTVEGGVVVLAGRVATETERARALELARAVPGVIRVDDRLSVGAGPEAVPTADQEPGRLSALTTDYPRPIPRHLAVGGVFTVPFTRSGTLDGLPSLGPVFRLGRGPGWRPVITLTRTRADLPPAAGTDAFGELRLLTLGGGVGYGFTFDRWMVTVGGSAGWSFNHIRLEPGSTVPTGTALPVAASSSPALIAGSTLWFEASRRVSVGVTGAYLWTRPEATWLEGNRFFRRPLDAESVLAGVSLAWWLF